MAEVSLNHVGIVLGLELSRLSRSNKDWHQLVDVCGIFNTLLCDQDGVYDSSDGNDRLLLGMKGAMSEFELVTLRNRLLRGTRNKAERGELFLSVPVGYFKHSSEQVVQDPDEQARAMIRLVFDKFAELRSAVRRVPLFHGEQTYVLAFADSAASGSATWNGGRRQRPESWRSSAIPIYAGAYAYGLHRAGKKNPVTGVNGGWKVVRASRRTARVDSRSIARLHLLGAILGEPRATAAERARKGSRGAPKRGEALLSGLVVCGKCGHHMNTRYPGDKKPCVSMQ